MLKRRGFIETRNFQRVKVPYLVKYRLAGVSGANRLEDRISNIKDISGGGVAFKVREPLPVSTLLELQINFFPARRVINVRARVVRIEEAIKGSLYEVGASFVDIIPKDQDAIIEYVKTYFTPTRCNFAK